MDGQALTFDDSTFDAAFSILSTTLFPDWGGVLDEAVRVVRPSGWLGIVHWASPYGADIFTILLRALKELPLPAGSLSAPEITVLRSADEIRAALEARECEVVGVELLDAPSPLPARELHGHVGSYHLSHLSNLFARRTPTRRTAHPPCRGSSPMDQGGRARRSRRFADILGVAV